MKLTLSDIEKIYNYSAGTLRYYDRSNLIPWFQRMPSGKRYIDFADITNIELIDLMKKCGCSLTQIEKLTQEAASALEHPETAYESFSECAQDFDEVCDMLIQQMTELSNQLQLARYMRWYFQTSAEAGTALIHRSEKAPKYPQPLPPNLPDYMQQWTYSIGIVNGKPAIVPAEESDIDMDAVIMRAVHEKYPNYPIPEDLMRRMESLDEES